MACRKDGVGEAHSHLIYYFSHQQSFSRTTEPHSAPRQLLIHQSAGWDPEGPFYLGTSLASSRCRADAAIQLLPAGCLHQPKHLAVLQRWSQSEKLAGLLY